MAFNPKAWLDTARTLDRPLGMEASHRKLIEKQAEEIQALKDRLTKLEAHVQAREEIVVAEAQGAAAAVASTVASQHVSAISHSVGRLQGRLDGMGRRLSPPASSDDDE
jgi:VIT1/CCC1 family predicted Fe2+/Mn2+ transporter